VRPVLSATARESLGTVDDQEQVYTSSQWTKFSMTGSWFVMHSMMVTNVYCYLFWKSAKWRAIHYNRPRISSIQIYFISNWKGNPARFSWKNCKTSCWPTTTGLVQTSATPICKWSSFGGGVNCGPPRFGGGYSTSSLPVDWVEAEWIGNWNL
jgi:hypothetical protein